MKPSGLIPSMLHFADIALGDLRHLLAHIAIAAPTDVHPRKDKVMILAAWTPNKMEVNTIDGHRACSCKCNETAGLGCSSSDEKQTPEM